MEDGKSEKSVMFGKVLVSSNALVRKHGIRLILLGSISKLARDVVGLISLFISGRITQLVEAEMIGMMFCKDHILKNSAKPV
jgi:hypothetical protein